jgi:hypothetical protein
MRVSSEVRPWDWLSRTFDTAGEFPSGVCGPEVGEDGVRSEGQARAHGALDEFASSIRKFIETVPTAACSGASGSQIDLVSLRGTDHTAASGMVIRAHPAGRSARPTRRSAGRGPSWSRRRVLAVLDGYRSELCGVASLHWFGPDLGIILDFGASRVCNGRWSVPVHDPRRVRTILSRESRLRSHPGTPRRDGPSASGVNREGGQCRVVPWKRRPSILVLRAPAFAIT